MYRKKNKIPLKILNKENWEGPPPRSWPTEEIWNQRRLIPLHIYLKLPNSKWSISLCLIGYQERVQRKWNKTLWFARKVCCFKLPWNRSYYHLFVTLLRVFGEEGSLMWERGSPTREEASREERIGREEVEGCFGVVVVVLFIFISCLCIGSIVTSFTFLEYSLPRLTPSLTNSVKQILSTMYIS